MKNLKKKKEAQNKLIASQKAKTYLQNAQRTFDTAKSIDATRGHALNIVNRIRPTGDKSGSPIRKHRLRRNNTEDDSDSGPDKEEERRINEEKLKKLDQDYLNVQGEDKEENIFTRNGIKDQDGMKPWQEDKLISPYIVRANEHSSTSQGKSSMQQSSNVSELDKTAQSRSDAEGDQDESHEFSGEDRE